MTSHSPLRKKKTITLSKAKKKAWDAFSRYIRLRDAIKTTGTKEFLLCITCDHRVPAFGVGCAQAGHFIIGRHASILLDPRGCHGQCYICNFVLKGNSLKYYRKMQEMYGDKVIEELERRNEEAVDFKVFDYLQYAEDFTKEYKKLNKESV